MTRRNPPAKWVLPTVIDPPRICFQIEVPNEPQHIAAFRGAILNLASALKWQDDPAHTAKQVAAVWDDVYTKIRTCTAIDCADQGITLEDFMSQQIRLKPDDPCIIQMWCIDGWQDWYDPRGCIPGSVEQPTNGGDLAAGECREWDVSLRGGEKWLLPVPVSENDTILISEASGAWNDGGLIWNCVNGFTYAAGVCFSADAANVGDPMPTMNHMRLIMNVDGDWFDAYNTLFPVQAGVTDALVYFQANDSVLEGNSGSVSFHLKLCKASDTPTGITVSYDLGSGPSEVFPGETHTFTTTCCGGGGAGDYGVHFTLSSALKMTVVNEASYVLTCNPCLYSYIKNAGSTVNSLSSPAHINLVDMPVSTGDEYDGECGGGGAPFFVTIKFEAP